MLVALMSTNQALFMAVFIAGLLVYAWIMSRDARDRRRLRTLPVTAIAAAPVGAQVRLQGFVHRHEEELTSPLTGQAGVYYGARLDEKQGKSWIERVRETKGVDFILRDASGEALVRVHGARWLIRVDHRSNSGTFDPANEAQAAFLRRHERSATNFLGLNRALRYEERVLEVGSWVSVFAKKTAASGPQFVVEAGPHEFLIADEDPPERAPN